MKHLSEKVFGHAQNLNKHGSMWWRGRAWLHFPRATFGLEWSFGRHARFWCAHLQFNDRGDSQIQVHAAFPRLFSIFLTVESTLLQRWLPGCWKKYNDNGEEKRFWFPEDREIGISIHDGTVWFSLWRNPMEWYKGQPGWWEFSINPKDILLGRTKHSKRDLFSGTVPVEMPEGTYTGTYTVFESTWKRPRWPWPRRMVRTEMDLQPPIPVPGKGENSWDCEDDGIWSITCPESTPEGAAERIRESTLRDRLRYAGPGWVPDDGWPV